MFRLMRPLLRLGPVAALLVLAAACGTSTTRPIDDPVSRAVEIQPAWAPTESLIAYTHLAQTVEEMARGRLQIFIRNLNSGETTFVAPGSSPTWSPGGDSLVFTDVHGGRLYVADLATGQVTPFTGIAPCASPAWFPGRARIAFVTIQLDPRGAPVIWTIGANGAGVRDITEPDAEEWGDPSWSPGGDSIVHYRYLTSLASSELFIMAADGSGGRQLTFDNARNGDPAWNPAGGSIAWARFPASGPYGIHVYDLATGQASEVIEGGEDPSWSPRGDSLAFAMWAPDLRGWSRGFHPSPPAGLEKRIWISDAKGRGRRLLAR